jgi:hypothetical protein
VNPAPVAKWLAERLSAESRDWLERALASARQGGIGSDAFAIAWSGCSRRLGKATLDVSTADIERLRADGLEVVPAHWSTDEAGRAVLLLHAVQQGQGQGGPALTAEAVTELFARGELREQQALLRVLAYLPEPERYTELAADAVRSNALTVLEALVCDNPFPSRHMPDLAFNQMIMKAIFNGLPLRRVVGLGERTGTELRRMVSAYASERRAAGRPVPADVDLILGGTPNAPV